MAKTWEDYLLEVLPDTPGCPVQVAENAIRNSAIEFCNESRVWRDRPDDVPVTQGTSVYPIVTPANSEMIALHRVKHADESTPMFTIPTIHLDQARLSTTQQRPRWFNQPTPATVEFFLVPDATYTIELWAILKPTKDATEGEDFLFDDWLEPIAHGAKARLKAMAARPWGDKSMIQFHRRLFINGWVEARIRDAKSNVASSSTARPQSFGQYRNTRRLY